MRFFLCVFAFLLVASCQRKEAAEKETAPKIITFKLPGPYTYGYDTTEVRCKNDLERAKKDFKNGKLVFEYFGLFTKSRDEIEELLHKKGIAFNSKGENCTALSNCYGYYMDSIIKKKWGTNFFDNLKLEATKLSESRWETKVYNYAEVDSSAVYPNTTDVLTVDNYCCKKIKLPSNWDKNEGGFIRATVIIKNNGKAVVADGDWFDYSLKKNNQRHLRYLKSEFRRIINEMDVWKPAEMNNHKVNAEEYLTISF